MANVLGMLVGFSLIGVGISMGSLIHIILFAGCGGFILAFVFCRMIGDRLGDAVYFTRDKLERPAERLDRVKGLVEEQRYDEARAELKAVLIRDFMDIEARMLLIRVCREELDDEAEAIAVCRGFFDHPGHASNRDSLDMLLYLSDVLPPPEALEYLRRELKRGRYCSYDRRLLRNRLEAIQR